MVEKQRNAVVQGAGLGFLLSAVLFVVTWNLLAFLAVFAGAAAGYALGRSPIRACSEQPVLEPVAFNTAEEGFLARWLRHPSLAVRAACLVTLGILIFLLAWTAGYDLLDEGALRSGAQAQLESRGLGGQAESASAEGLKIFFYNLFPFVLVVLTNLLVRVNGIPLGYIVPLYNILLYGLFVGSNSFLIPHPERMAPSFAILGRAGPYEMLAFLLAAAASATWSYYQVRRLFRTAPEAAAGRAAIRPAQVVLMIFALLLLAAAAFIEGAMVVGR